jgi:hypothetical protein
MRSMTIGSPPMTSSSGNRRTRNPCASEPCILPLILDIRIRRLVCAPVRLDDDLSRKTNEIREIRSNRSLSAKAVSIDLMIPQRAPEHDLRSRHVLTLRPSELARGLTKTRRLVHLVHQSYERPVPYCP